MAQTTRGGFLLREPNRNPLVADGAAVLGSVLNLIPREQNPAHIPGAVDNERYRERSKSFQVLPPASAGPHSTVVKKGYIVSRRTGAVHPFMFNPTEITRRDAWEWAHHKIPGASHPIVSGGSGGSRMITFTLYFDGDRGRIQHRERVSGFGRSGPNARVAIDDPRSLDVSPELRFYRSFTHPRPKAGSFKERGPDHLILNYGTLFPRVECVMHSCPVTVTMLTPFLEPVKATAQVTLEEVVRQSVSCTTVSPDPIESISGIYGLSGGDIG